MSKSKVIVKKSEEKVEAPIKSVSAKKPVVKKKKAVVKKKITSELKVINKDIKIGRDLNFSIVNNGAENEELLLLMCKNVNNKVKECGAERGCVLFFRIESEGNVYTFNVDDIKCCTEIVNSLKRVIDHHNANHRKRIVEKAISSSGIGAEDIKNLYLDIKKGNYHE